MKITYEKPICLDIELEPDDLVTLTKGAALSLKKSIETGRDYDDDTDFIITVKLKG